MTDNKNLLLRYKATIVYSISLAFLLFLLKWLELRFIIFDHSFEIYIGFIAVMIVLIASTIYVVAWLIDYFFFIPDFAEKYSAHMLDKLKASGASQIEIDKQTQEMASLGRMYKNPF